MAVDDWLVYKLRTELSITGDTERISDGECFVVATYDDYDKETGLYEFQPELGQTPVDTVGDARLTVSSDRIGWMLRRNPDATIGLQGFESGEVRATMKAHGATGGTVAFPVAANLCYWFMIQEEIVDGTRDGIDDVRFQGAYGILFTFAPLRLNLVSCPVNRGRVTIDSAALLSNAIAPPSDIEYNDIFTVSVQWFVTETLACNPAPDIGVVVRIGSDPDYSDLVPVFCTTFLPTDTGTEGTFDLNGDGELTPPVSEVLQARGVGVQIDNYEFNIFGQSELVIVILVEDWEPPANPPPSTVKFEDWES